MLHTKVTLSNTSVPFEIAYLIRKYTLPSMTLSIYIYHAQTSLRISRRYSYSILYQEFNNILRNQCNYCTVTRNQRKQKIILLFCKPMRWIHDINLAWFSKLLAPQHSANNLCLFANWITGASPWFSVLPVSLILAIGAFKALQSDTFGTDFLEYLWIQYGLLRIYLFCIWRIFIHIFL